MNNGGKKSDHPVDFSEFSPDLQTNLTQNHPRDGTVFSASHSHFGRASPPPLTLGHGFAQGIGDPVITSEATF